MTAAEVAAAVSAGTLSAHEAVMDALERLEARGDLNAVITLCGERALARARAQPRGRLAGVPLLVKDLIDTAGVRTTYASAIHHDHIPATTAPAVAALEAEGAIVVGKANADEFAWGVTGQNAHYGDVVNPRHPGRIAGGSSAGNAAALAAGLVPLALGTDTGGSVRMPAAACGVVGLKPALGAVGTEGVFPLAASFDTVGPMARTVADCARAHAILTGEGIPKPRVEGFAVGVLTTPPDLTGHGVAAAGDEAARAAPPSDRPAGAAPAGGEGPSATALAAPLAALGAEVSEVTLPYPPGDTWPIFYGEAAEVHRSTFPACREEYGPTIRAKLDEAQRVTATELAAARRALAQWRSAARDAPAVDLVVSPTLGMDELPAVGVDELEIRLPFSAYTRPFSYLGWPAIALGDLQLAGRRSDVVIGAALALEREGVEERVSSGSR